MAFRPLLSGLKRNKLQVGSRNLPRFISSRASSIDTNKNANSNLKNQILRLKSPSLTVVSVLQHWVDNGRKVTVSQLRYISKSLVKLKRYKHALEVYTWMETQYNFPMLEPDHAIRLELIIEVNGLKEAEEYFKLIPAASIARKAASLTLLHGYVKERDVGKAEAFMMNLNSLGLIVNCHPFNEMMKLYMATLEHEKVPLVIEQMKRNRIRLNVLSYNLWMSSYIEASEVVKVEMVYKEMVNDENVEVGWSTLSTLANIYTKAGVVDKALLALKNAEKKLSTSHRLGYFFLITQYSLLKNKEGVRRLWEASKGIRGRITCANYICILSCLVKVNDLLEAERVFREWEANRRKYDIRVSNVLLGAYVREGLMNRAESLHLHILKKGGCPNYKTWEILMEGWVKSQKMDKAISAMKQALPILESCLWRPSNSIIMAIAEHLEQKNNFEDANHFVRFIHTSGLASLPLYKLILRMHLHAQTAAFDILKMMEKDRIELDDETSALVQALYSYG